MDTTGPGFGNEQAETRKECIQKIKIKRKQVAIGNRVLLAWFLVWHQIFDSFLPTNFLQLSFESQFVNLPLATGSLLLSEFLGPASSSTSLFPLCLPRHHFLPSPSTPHRLKLSALALSSLLSIEYPSISSRIVFKQQHPSLGAGVFLGLLPWFVVSILEAYQERKRLDQQGPPSLLRSTLPELSTLTLFFFFSHSLAFVSGFYVLFEE